MHTIEFDNQQLLDANPNYTFDLNSVSFLGEVSADVEFPGDMVLKGYSTNGSTGYTPVTATFDIPVREAQVTLNGAPTGSVIIGYDARGNILFAEQLAQGMTQTVVSFDSDTNGVARMEIWDDAQTIVDNFDPATLLDGAVALVTGLVNALTSGDDPFVEVDLAQILPIVGSDAAVTLSYPAGAGGGIGVPAFDRISFDRDFDAYVDGDGTLTGTNGEDLIEAGDGTDTLSGGNGDDVMRGYGGDDTLDGGEGADYIDGGAGIDTADYSASTAAVEIDLEAGTGLGGSAEGDVLIGIENILGSDQNDVLVGSLTANTLIGGGGADTLSGAAGDDTLIGDAGNDRLIGGEGGDILNGGAGLDWVVYTGSTEAISVDLSAATATGGDAAGDQLIGIERVLGSDFNDTIIGDANNNMLVGASGNDTVIGNGGDDRLEGGEGADVIDGGAGTRDTAVYTNSTAIVHIDLAAGTATGGEAEGDTLIAVERLWGSAFDDNLTGDALDNMLRGDAGDDTLSGGDGDDLMRGDEGADIIDGGAGTDSATYFQSDAAVTINLASGLASGGHATGDQLSNIEDVQGSRFDDTLTGDAGTNFLHGNGGDDILRGGAGRDFLQGDAGADTFVFAANDGNDRIQDFEDGVDTIQMIGLGFGDLTIASHELGASVDYGSGCIVLLDVAATDLAEDDFLFV